MLSTVIVGVLNNAPAVLVGLKSGKGSALKVIDDRSDLIIRRLILARPTDHARGIAMHGRQPCRHVSHHQRVAPQHADGSSLSTGMVVRGQQIGRCTMRIAGPVRQEFDVHVSAPLRHSPLRGGGVDAQWRTVGSAA